MASSQESPEFEVWQVWQVWHSQESLALVRVGHGYGGYLQATPHGRLPQRGSGGRCRRWKQGCLLMCNRAPLRGAGYPFVRLGPERKRQPIRTGYRGRQGSWMKGLLLCARQRSLLP